MMPSSPFASEVERQRAREALIKCVEYEFDTKAEAAKVFDAKFPPIADAPEDWRSDHSAVGEAIKARRKPTPPDFDAALDEFEEVARKHQHSSREWPYADVIGARQRVRELYEAVVRERDAARDEAQRCRELMVSHCEYLKRKHDEVRDALTPLAREYVRGIELTSAVMGLEYVLGIYGHTVEQFTAARAVLAKEGT